MRKFNKDKYLRKLKIKRFFRNNSRYFYIVLSCLLCGFLGIYFTYSKFFISDEQAVIRTTVGDFTRGDIVLNIYVDGKKVSEAPKKNTGYSMKNISCNNGNVVWSDDNWKLTVTNISGTTKCDLYFIESPNYFFNYTGTEQKITIPKTGYYVLEVWGAQGGNASSSAIGGYGGYAIGKMRLSKNDELYINVGEQGSSSLIFTNSFVAGGHFAYNGGGQSSSNSDTKWAGGGGATHIAIKSGQLSSLENNKDDILIVSGGGGGSGNYSSTQNNGGAGGGYKGMSGSGRDVGTGATQNTPGTNSENGVASSTIASAFGQGGSAGSGGGGGFYGGGSGYGFGSSAGGGSGYIGNPLLFNKTMYCYNCTTSTDYDTKTQTTTCSEATPTKNCSKKGNGYAKISYLPITIDYYIEDKKIETIPNKDNYILKEMSCEKSSNITWNYNIWNVDISDYQENDTCKIVFNSSKVAKIINQLDTTGKCPTVSTDSSITLSGVETSNNYVCSIPDTYGTSYYYRGNVTNNYVKFANLYWRIIRVNGDESIRVIYDGTIAHANGESSTDRHIGTSKFNSSNNDNTYVGYMYGNKGATSYSDAHTNTNDSVIKSYLDSWYKTNIIDKNYDSYVVDNIFCNDRSIKSGNGYGTSGTNYRWYYLNSNGSNNKTAILKCLQQNDAFTASDTTNGNGKLTYPIGLITSDEAFLAGGNGADNSKYYLYTGSSYWTMSPNRAFTYEKIVKNNVVYGSGYASHGYDVAVNAYVKPVINLKSDILKNGNGTLDNPYHLSEEE